MKFNSFNELLREKLGNIDFKNSFSLKSRIVYFYGFLVILLIYFILWYSVAISTKNAFSTKLTKEINFGKNSKFSYESLEVSGFPFKINIDVIDPKLSLDVLESIKYLHDKDLLVIAESKLVKENLSYLFDFSHNLDLAIADKVIFTFSPFTSDIEINSYGDTIIESKFNDTLSRYRISAKQNKMIVKFNGDFFLDHFHPLESFENFLTNFEGVEYVSDSVALYNENNISLYYFDNMATAIKFSSDNLDDFKLGVSYQSNNVNSNKSFNDLILNLYDVPLYALILNNEYLIGDFLYDYEKGGESEFIEFLVSAKISDILKGNLDLKFILSNFSLENDLISYDLSGALDGLISPLSGDFTLKANFNLAATREWYDYKIKSTNHHSKLNIENITKIKNILRNFNINFTDEDFIPSLYYHDLPFLSLRQKNLHYFVPELHKLGQKEINIDLHATYGSKVKLSINSFVIRNKKYEVNLKTDLDYFHNDNSFTGEAILKLINYRSIIDDLFQLTQTTFLVTDLIKKSDRKRHLTTEDKILVLKLMKILSDNPNSNDETLSFTIKSNKDMIEPTIGNNNLTEALIISSQFLNPIFKHYDFSNKVINNNINHNNDNISYQEKAACYQAGKLNAYKDVKRLCKRLFEKGGDQKADFYYAKMYLFLGQSAKDKNTAFLIFKNVSENNYAPAYSFLAKLYESGIGTAKDLKQAENWYLKTFFEKKSSTVAIHIADFYENSGDPLKASAWYLVSYQLGNNNGLAKVKATINKTSSDSEEVKKNFDSAKSLANKIIKSIN